MRRAPLKSSPRSIENWPFLLSFCLLVLVALAVTTGPVQAQPFGGWIILDSSSADYIEVPHSPALNPTGQLTVEAWVSISNDSSCRSLVGKDWQEAWWLGICGNSLRTYTKGSSSQRNAGIIPNNQWTHVAVTFNGNRRRHYINGEEVGSWVEPGPLTTSSAPMQIGRDVSWSIIPDGAMDEVRVWNVARTTAQIRDTINDHLGSPQPGLQAVWAMNAAQDELGNHDGSLVGSPAFLTFPVGTGCTPGDSSTVLCLMDRFQVTVDWRTGSGTTGQGTVVPGATERSGLFWFFAPDNWEMLVKMVNGCGSNNHKWFFGAATTNVFYRLEVFDIRGGANKIYFNHLGESAVSVTDSRALATCP